jgi:capsular exopolysaccharide synthesis family protein
MDTPYVTEVRRLLQSLSRGGRDRGTKTYLITSAGRGEGKSTTCALMAIVAAKIFRRRVLVIDSDIRRPALHHLFGISQRPGLCEILEQRAPVEAAIRATPLPTLFAIPSGSPQGPVAEAYDDETFARLIARVRGEYDLVLVDAAPVVPVVEPTMMAEHLDAILIVTMAGRTPLSMLRRMKQILAPVSERIAGVILNNASEGLPYYYDYGYYGYEPITHRRIRIGRHGGAAPAPGSEPRPGATE